MKKNTHILIVDDDERIRELLCRFLQKNGFLVTTARDAARARNLLTSFSFDLIVLDVMMPGEDGTSLTKAIHAQYGTAVLLLTAKGEIESRIVGLEAGADDYMTKPFEPKELLLRINAILRRTPIGNTQDPVRYLKLGEVHYDTERRELWQGGQHISLTTTEEALMRHFATHPRKTFTRAQLLKALGDNQGSAQERTIDVQITRLRRKIETDPRQPRYLQTIRGSGYMLAPD